MYLNFDDIPCNDLLTTEILPGNRIVEVKDFFVNAYKSGFYRVYIFCKENISCENGEVKNKIGTVYLTGSSVYDVKNMWDTYDIMLKIKMMADIMGISLSEYNNRFYTIVKLLKKIEKDEIFKDTGKEIAIKIFGIKTHNELAKKKKYKLFLYTDKLRYYSKPLIAKSVDELPEYNLRTDVMIKNEGTEEPPKMVLKAPKQIKSKKEIRSVVSKLKL